MRRREGAGLGCERDEMEREGPRLKALCVNLCYMRTYVQ